MSVTAKNKNLEIECLRGIAVILTMLSHLPVLLPFYDPLFTRIFFSRVNPWTGVDLFFCVSGFVVSKTYVEVFDRYRQQGLYWLAAQNFFIRRAYRLFPTAWLWASLGLICSVWLNRSGIFATWFDNLRSIALILTFSGNYGNQFGRLLYPNDVYWSLALEEQFYFLFPLFLFFVTSKRWRVKLLCLLVVIQFFMCRNPFGTFAQGMAAAFRLDGVMWGVLIYLFSRSRYYAHFEPVFLQRKIVGLAVILGLLYLLVAIPAQLIKLPTATGLIAIVTALLVFLASFQKGYIFKVPILSSLLVWIGARSYGIYLIHIFSYRLAYEIFTRYTMQIQIPFDVTFTWPLLATALALTFVLSELNYRLIEVPLRNRGSAITKQREHRIKESIAP